MTIALNIDTIPTLIGIDLGRSRSIIITQDRINAFAAATGDEQWIHVDEERAREGPYGKTIAHGLLTLSMIGVMSQDVFRFAGFKMGLNYGFEKVRFPAPVPVGSQIRLGAKIVSFEKLPNAVQTVIELAVEIEGATKPACVAQMIFRHTP